jgi:hypothetical protein
MRMQYWPCTLLFFLVVSLPSENTVAQTSIVAIRTPQKIFIGADSKGTKGGNKNKIVNVCKIRQFGGSFCAFSGLSEVPETHFRVWDITKNAFRHGNTLLDKINAFETLITTPLSKALHYVRQVNPTDFKRSFDTADKVVLQMIFATVEDGIPKIFVRDFQISTTDPITFNIHKKSCPGTCPTGRSVYFLGQKEAMMKYYDEHSEILRSGLDVAIDILIRVAITNSGDEVGLPIDILRVKNPAHRAGL